MQPLTEKQTQRVWSRVMSAQTAPAAAMENPAPRRTGAERNADAGKTAFSDRRRTRRQRSVCPSGRPDEGAGTGDAARHRAAGGLPREKKLAAVYFLNTGKKACPGRPERPLRHLHQRNAPPAVHRGARRARGLRRARRECRDAPVHAAAHGAGGMRARAADPLHPAELPVKKFFFSCLQHFLCPDCLQGRTASEPVKKTPAARRKRCPQKHRQHRTIASAHFGGSFPPILRFSNLGLAKSLSPNLLAELYGAANHRRKLIMKKVSCTRIVRMRAAGLRGLCQAAAAGDRHRHAADPEPLTDYASLDEAEAAAGFDLAIPDAVDGCSEKAVPRAGCGRGQNDRGDLRVRRG